MYLYICTLYIVHACKCACVHVFQCVYICQEEKFQVAKQKLQIVIELLQKFFIQPNGHLNKAKARKRCTQTHTLTERDNKNNIFGIKSIGNVNGSRFYLLIHRQFVLVNMLKIVARRSDEKGRECAE